MCGIAGVFDLTGERQIETRIIEKMLDIIRYRGPDDKRIYTNKNITMGFVRLSIMDIKSGSQPLTNENGQIVSACNGEIYNIDTVKHNLEQKGHIFKSSVDTEIIPHLYEEYGIDFVKDLNGQFAFSLWDNNLQQLYLARDHFGISPLYYTIINNWFIFASEIKSILQHPDVKPIINLEALDQIFSFPGLVSPQTMFHNIFSIAAGQVLTISRKLAKPKLVQYWDFNYQRCNESLNANYYIEGLEDHLKRAINYRLKSDVPIGFYLSGGLDSSLILGMAKTLSLEKLQTYSITFPDDNLICEKKYQRLMSDFCQSHHNEISFQKSDVIQKLRQVIYHAECPLKESFNTAAMSLAQNVNKTNIKVIIGGQGADELFAGYPSYKFDQMRKTASENISKNEQQTRLRLWGDKTYFYERSQSEFRDIKYSLYSNKIREQFDIIDCTNKPLINTLQLKNLSLLQKRSYLDFKLRLADHLLSDHGDKMLMSASVEGRYPFLDQDLVKFVKTIPDDLKLKDFNEKYILKIIAEKYIPKSIINREKFGFTAPGSPYILNQNIEYVNELLSYNTIKQQGYFDPTVVQKLKHKYMQPNYRINVPYETDLLMTVLTFGIFLTEFKLPTI